ncbi:MAG: type II toxin-antitoxin system Phd/YefM family antitoxin [Deltaproteobacteria bacterium]|nr:type II toxin-antitoxin system Phd/YefM family antitoxin [Deltaproteobacteria bacterium]
MNLSDSVKPISYLKSNAADLIDQVSKGKSFVITQYGEAKAVLLDIESYESLNTSLALLKILSQSQENIRKKKYSPLKKSFHRVKQSLSKK